MAAAVWLGPCPFSARSQLKLRQHPSLEALTLRMNDVAEPNSLFAFAFIDSSVWYYIILYHITLCLCIYIEYVDMIWVSIVILMSPRNPDWGVLHTSAHHFLPAAPIPRGHVNTFGAPMSRVVATDFCKRCYVILLISAWGAKFNWLARDVLPCLTSLSLNLLFLRFLALLPPFAVGWTSEAKLATRRTQSQWWNRNQWCNVEIHCTGAFHRYGKTHDHCNFSSSYQPSDSSGVWFSVAYFKAIAPRVSWMNLVPGTGTWHWICSI